MLLSDSAPEAGNISEFLGHDEFLLTIDIDYLPAAYVGRLVSNIASLYQEMTGDVMLLCEAKPGSLILRLKVRLAENLSPFVRVMRGLFKHYPEEKVSQKLADNLEAVSNILPSRDQKNRLELEYLQTQIEKQRIENQQAMLFGLPKFVGITIEAYKKYDPRPPPDRVQAVVDRAEATYRSAFGLEPRRALSAFAGQEDLEQLDNLKGRFRIEYRPLDGDSGT